jgi:hypothetical protein
VREIEGLGVGARGVLRVEAWFGSGRER